MKQEEQALADPLCPITHTQCTVLSATHTSMLQQLINYLDCWMMAMKPGDKNPPPTALQCRSIDEDNWTTLHIKSSARGTDHRQLSARPYIHRSHSLCMQNADKYRNKQKNVWFKAKQNVSHFSFDNAWGTFQWESSKIRSLLQFLKGF